MCNCLFILHDFIQLQMAEVENTPSKGVTLCNQPWAIRPINGLLWICECQATIELFDTQLEKRDTITLDDNCVGAVYDVLQMNAEECILASEGGLFLLHMETKATNLLRSGKFKSLALNDSILYAFAYENAQVYCFSYAAGEKMLKEKQVIQPSLAVKEKQFATIAVRKNEIFVCSMADNKIFVHELSGKNKLVRTLGDYGTLNVGRLNYPVIAQQLKDGSLLIADHDNHRYQLLRPDNRWEQVLRLGTKFPRGCLYSDGKLFTVSYSERNWLEVHLIGHL